jgi:hypothetical protein
VREATTPAACERDHRVERIVDVSRIKEALMDGTQFDTLAKTLAAVGSRRQALGALLVTSLALLSKAQTEEAAAHDAKKKCQKKSGDAKKKCLKKAKKHNRQDATQTPTETTTIPPSATPVGPPPPAEIPATCSDGVKNGSESDIDCGGPTCLRCATGKTCGGQADCASAFCVNNVCTACTTGQCGAGCGCAFGSCVSNTPTKATVCTNCPPYSYCAPLDESSVECYPPCG